MTDAADRFRFKCLNCGAVESARGKMPDLAENLGPGKAVRVGDIVEFICWDCGTTQRHEMEEAEL